MLKLTKAKQIKTNIEYFSRFLQVLNNGDGNKLLSYLIFQNIYIFSKIII
jgi:hypothetical protein